MQTETPQNVVSDQGLHCLPLIQQFQYPYNPINWDGQAWANSVDPDQMPQNVASDQGLHCLPLIQHYFKHINS